MKRPYVQKYRILRLAFWNRHLNWVPGKGWVKSLDMTDRDWLWRWTP